MNHSPNGKTEDTPAGTNDDNGEILAAEASDPAIKLLEGEKVVYVEHLEVRKPRRPPAALRELVRLNNYGEKKAEGEIVELGPVLASLALEQADIDPGTDSEELHKFEALFGRDSLRVAMDLLPYKPGFAHNTVMVLARMQGTESNLHREEEPGRIIHEARLPHDPIAIELTKRNGWGWPYYGSVDSTPEFVRTIAAYCQRFQDSQGQIFLNETFTAKDGTEKKVSDALVAAVDWITGRMNANREGLLEFKPVFDGSTENQAWKDSPDSYFHKDGTLANHGFGIASIEVQRVAYDALLDAANLFDSPLGLNHESAELRQRARNLRKQIFKQFWTEDEDGYFVLGTDRDEHQKLRQLKVKTSNMGHMLRGRLLKGDADDIVQKREAVIRRLFSPEMLNVSGIRTLATDEVRFRPGAYHNGSVWPWENYLIAQGLASHGYWGLYNELVQRTMRVFNTTQRFPEYVRGDDGAEPSTNTTIIDIYDPQLNRINRIEQPPQEVQAWSVGSSIAIKHSTKLKRPTRAAEGTRQRILEDEILGNLPNRAT